VPVLGSARVPAAIRVCSNSQRKTRVDEVVLAVVAVSVPVRCYYCVCLLCASANRWRGGRGGDDGCVADSSDGGGGMAGDVGLPGV